MEQNFTATFVPPEEKLYTDFSPGIDRTQDYFLLREEHQSLKENIQYARFLQTQLFQATEIINRTAKDSFILDLPRDIVSGDFGWFHEEENTLLMVVGDCTGHGVPAALLSMVMKNFLNHRVCECGIKKPAEIITELNNYLFRLNKGSNHPSLAGLDIGICSIDKQEQSIFFCGANRPLYVMRNGNLIIVKDSRYMMGSAYAEKNIFAENILPYVENDMLYLFSDGFCDQFGGTYNKKLLNRRLKWLLTDMRDSAMEEQKKLLENFFSVWKAGMEQTDDVYITGLLL